MTTPLTANAKAALSPDDLGHQIEVLRADLVKLAATLSDDVSEGIGQATHKVGQTGRDAQASATNAVLGHPLTAVAIAAGVGLLLGLVARKA
ncbi:glycine zipper domain-containing protein [Defluviimonas salinarum]|uniref:DUF883 domain-containing protein n=1 Tax=Defluviimonas salinarum TaxID=2992147 RepID=A0ABT3JAC2_9RHOB|nr:hypothetical protein [Defluviimonas salinarum]MCW3784641.1 hypothetical protein [Defluviimonas salinarum]